ncbi:unnamed protein product [Rotaria sp. Silwood2]|nr:unnamed protein product [Rotaria sp. Silwood2]CAF4562326.1 unnamed protein product [Rotaria sp. Silwood2]
MDSRNCGAVETMLRKNYALKELNLSSNHFAGENAGCICEALTRTNRTLEVLDLSGNQLTDSSMLAVISMLQTNPILRVLRLHGNSINDLTEQLFNVMARENTTLTHLSLTYRDNFSDSAIETIASVFKTNKTLKDLRIESTRLGDDCVQAICSALKNQNRTLTLLELTFTKLTNASVSAVIDMISNNQTLQELHLYESGISPENQSKIKNVAQKRIPPPQIQFSS